MLLFDNPQNVFGYKSLGTYRPEKSPKHFKISRGCFRFHGAESMQIVLLFFLRIFKPHLLPSVRMMARPTAYSDAAV
jgi:hypothetical protein